MKSVITFWCTMTMFITSYTVEGQEIVNGKGPFQLEVDVARFYGDSAMSYIEMYYGIRENMLSYKHDSSRYVGAANMKWIIRNDSAVVAHKEWTVPHIVDDSLRFATTQTMMGLESVGLPVGEYMMSIDGYDLYDTARRDSFVLPLRVVAYPSNMEAMSDIEFCMSVQSSTNKQSVFYKNTLEVIPNAGKLYGAGLPIMYYYAEAYNLAQSRSRANVTVRTTVVDALGKDVITRDKSKARLHNSSVEIGTVNLSSLKGGTYLFRISLLDSGKTALASTTKKFFVYKPGTVADSASGFAEADLATSEFAIMSEQEVDQAFAYAKYIATQAEVSQYEKLTDVKAKQKLLFEFWRRRDPDQSTPVNEVKEEYYKRVSYANDHLSLGFHEGWKTDRGRVHIVYGPYDEIERFPSSSESNPYEIWHYNNIQGGVIFVFVDRNGLGDFLLVHSTHRDEIHEDNWFQQYAQKMR
ncbi:MAG: GWxTD domain-containing protein [Ignavibacteria bacterium]|nr:GWxTD domain-containing protein [Ignavibacteria bacterium]